jgi:hypothetical protein
MLADREFGILRLAGATNFALLRSIETVSGPQKLFYPVGIEDISSEFNVART